MLKEAGLKDKEGKEQDKVYQDAMDQMTEVIIKEWKRKGKTDRDWAKIKILAFDENNKIYVKSTDAFKKEQKQVEIENANSVQVHSKKQIDKQFAMMKAATESALKKFDDNENESCETDCSICFNVMIDSCILPCRHRFCVQCMREHLSYQKECPLCRKAVPPYFKC